MKPPVPAATRFLAGMLRGDIAPHVTGFRAGNVAMSAAMLDMLADAWDGTAARLHAENQELAVLLDRCASLLGREPPASIANDDLRISALTAGNEALKSRLIEFHAALEESALDSATDLIDEIWAFLARSVDRQRVASANF